MRRTRPKCGMFPVTKATEGRQGKVEPAVSSPSFFGLDPALPSALPDVAAKTADNPAATAIWEQVPLPDGIRPADVFAPIAGHPFSQLLEWQGSDGTSYILTEPARTLTVTLAELDAATPAASFHRLQAALEDWSKENAFVPGALPVALAGGAAGFFAYELAHDLEHLPGKDKIPPETPVLTVGFYDAVLAFPENADHALALSPWDTPETAARRTSLHALVQGAVRLPSPVLDAGVEPMATVTPDAYRTSVARVIELIHAGDIFQANLAQRFDALLPDTVSAFDIYRRLSQDTPTPFAAHVTLPDRTLVSSSPERFLKVTATGTVRTEPIKGTRPRGTTPEQDQALARELLESPKDRAENVMIVDLLRNDLSRTCADHSVKVEALCELHSFANVHHLISTVTGQLRPDATSLDCMAACFPGGSITGAPKVRAMEIIADEEPHARGAYCGSIGFVGLDGALDTSIAIRTLTITGNEASYHAGGGIVADSTPRDEYEETLTKASAMRAALMGTSSS